MLCVPAGFTSCDPNGQSGPLTFMKKEICPVCKKEYDNKVGNTYHHSYTDDYGGYRSYDHVDVNAKIIGYREYTVKVPIYE